MDDFSKYLFAAAPASHVDSPAASIESPRYFNNKVTDNNAPAVKLEEKPNVYEDIISLEKRISKCKGSISACHVRNGLLVSHYKKESQLLLQINEITKCVTALHDRFKTLSERSSSTFYPRQSAALNQNQLPELESNCMRNVREVCENITSFYQQVHTVSLDDELKGSGNSLSNPKQQEQMWSRVEELSQLYSPEEIFDALLHNIKDSTSSLKDIASRIDLRKDAEQLKFKFETGQINDLCSEPVLLQTVSQLVEECQYSHFQKFLASEKSKNESHRLKKKLQKLNDEIDTILNKKFGNSDDVQQYSKFLKLQQQHNGWVASSVYLDEEVLRLEKEKNEKEKAMLKLLEKYNRIKNFEQATQDKQKIIQKLIQKNSSSKLTHTQQVQDIESYVNEKILPIHPQIKELSTSYVDKFTEEVAKYMEVPIQNLKCFSSRGDEKKLVKDLAIHRLNNEFDQPGMEALDKVMKSYNIAPYQSTENVLECIKEENIEVFESELSNSQMSKLSNDVSQSFAQINELHSELKLSHQAGTQNALPSLQKSKQRASEVMTECVKFRNASQIWWEEPAQYTVPWVTEDGLNLQQYKDQYNQLVQTLKKLQIVGSIEK